ncbi:MAG: hypothetical protein ACE5HN_01160 [Nitrospiria bacterium]
MLKVIEGEKEIKKAQQKFMDRFEQLTDEKIPVIIGYPGGHDKAKVSWISSLDIWTYFGEKAKNRYWNLFGLGKPKKDSMIPIVCEMNIPLNGINRRIGGAFAIDNAGDVILIHRGKIGGGRKGIGKARFQNNYRGKWEILDDGGFESEVALVGALSSSRFTRQVSRFVSEVERIKDLPPFLSPQNQGKHDSHKFSKEFAGKKKYNLAKNVMANCDHGIIVNDLSDALKNLGHEVGNNKNLDLYIRNSKNKIISIFEIKTEITTTSIHTAVGQLLLNSISLSKRPKLILTVPEKVSKTIANKLNKLGIELLTFRWKGENAVFKKLNALKF